MANTLKLYRIGAVGFMGWLDLLSQHDDVSSGFWVFEGDLVLFICGDCDNLLEFGGARQRKCAVTLDWAANADEFYWCGTLRVSDDTCLRDWAPMRIDHATAVRYPRSAARSPDDCCKQCNQRSGPHEQEI